MLPLRMLGPLMLMILLCDADSSCPTELTLDPPEVIGEYGETVLVNCTNIDEYHDGMYWKIGDTISDMEEDRNFITSPVSLSDWVVKAECRIKMNETLECNTKLGITVYKTPDSVSVSALHHGQVVEGSDFLLNCDIISVAPVQNLRVKWYRDEEVVDTQMFNDTSVFPVNVSSALRVTAHRDYHGAHFRCTAELHLGPKGPELIPTAVSPPYTAAVLYKPLIQDCSGSYSGVERKFSLDMVPCLTEGNPPPTVQWYYQGKPINASERLTRTHSGKYTADVANSIGSSSTSVDITIEYAPLLKRNTETVLVYEGENIILTCEADGNPAPVFTWTCDGVDLSENTANHTMTPVKTSARCSCTAANYLGNRTKQIHVEMVRTTSAATIAATITPETSMQTVYRPTLMPAEVVVKFGDPVSINCSTSDTDIFSMGWEDAFGSTEPKRFSPVTWTVDKLEQWTLKPKCYLIVNDSRVIVMPNITLYKTPDSVSVSALHHGQVVEGSDFLLNCDIISVAPVQNLRVKWYRDEEVVDTQMFNDTSVTPVNVSSALRVTAHRDYHGAHFRCKAELHLGPKGPELIPTAVSPPYTAAVLYKPLIQDCSGSYSGVERKFSLDMVPCLAEGNPPPTFQWYYQGKPINASERLTRTHSGKYTADVANSIGSSSTSVDITVEYSPSFSCSDHYEILEGGLPQTVCEPKGIPEPVLTWVKDGKEVGTPQRWTRHHSGKYSLTATNKHGEANHMFYLDVLYAPVFKEGNYTQGVTPGENVTFNCQAEGNPPPEIHWDVTAAANVMEATGGRQKNISITGATSTDAGVYICVATNRVGRVSRSVTLMMKGQAFAASRAVFWRAHILEIVGGVVCGLCLIILASVCLSHISKKKHGRYRFVPGEAKDGSEINMKTTSGGVQV